MCSLHKSHNDLRLSQRRSSLQWISPMAFKNSASMSSLSSLHLSSSSTSSSPSPPHTFKNYHQPQVHHSLHPQQHAHPQVQPDLHRPGLPGFVGSSSGSQSNLGNFPESSPMLSMQYSRPQQHEKVRLFAFRRKGSQNNQPPRTRRLSGSVMSNTFIPEHHVVAVNHRLGGSTQVYTEVVRIWFHSCHVGVIMKDYSKYQTCLRYASGPGKPKNRIPIIY